jgi:hypothetical protein
MMPSSHSGLVGTGVAAVGTGAGGAGVSTQLTDTLETSAPDSVPLPSATMQV